MFNFSIPPDERRDMLYRLFVTWSIAAVMTIALTADGEIDLIEQALYSFAVATLMWLFIDIGDFFIFTNTGKRYPFTIKRYLFIAVAILAANYCGFFIGDSLSGWTLLTTNPTQVWTWAFLELVITIAVIWFFNQQQHHIADRRLNYETHLRLLESQLEPHMLFNTLANLRALVNTDPKLATQMLDRIVDYMRANLGGSRTDIHPLSAEFSRLGDYLEIMKVRMGTRLSYTLDLPSQLANHPIPPFLLQPLVENAIKHGLEPKVEGGKITVTASIAGDSVAIDVCDTGDGSRGDALSPSNGFGLAQVTQRLAATYGDKGAVNFIATASPNTLYQVTFPFIKKHQLGI